MFGFRPSAPTRPEDYAGRPRRTTAEEHAGLKPRGLTPQAARAAGRRRRRASMQHVTPDPWVPAPAIALSDVIAGPEPWMGMLLDPARPRPVPIGSLIRSAGPGARRGTGWCGPTRGCTRREDSRGRIPRSVAAYLDEPAMAHFARELDDAAAEACHRPTRATAPLDARVIECAVAGGYGGDAAAADAVTAWITETLRRDIPKGSPHAGTPSRAQAGRAHPEPASRSAGWCADGSDGGDPHWPGSPAAAIPKPPPPPSSPPE